MDIRHHKIFLSGISTNLLYQNLIVATEIPIFFGTRDYLKKNIRSSYWLNSLSAIAATFCATLVAAPLDFLHTRIVFKALNVI